MHYLLDSDLSSEQSHPLFEQPVPDHNRVVTRYVGSGIKGVDSGIRRLGSGIAALRIRGSQTMGSESAVFLGIRDQVVPYLWDQGQKLVMLL